MSIEEGFTNRPNIDSLYALGDKTKVGINNAFQNIGKRLVSKSHKLIESTERAPWSYMVKIRGRYVRHHPSLPNHPAAEMTGKLKRSIGFINQGQQLIFGAGNKLDGSNPDSVNYAKYVELGTTRMVKRPYLKPSISKNESDSYRDLSFEIEKAINT